ncbi:MAG TPA: hypothetical protein VIY29_30500, partial [Ktedonobacteraceae bacterium]
IPIGKVARQHLNTYITYWRGVPANSADEHVFLNAFGNPLRPNAARNIFRNYSGLQETCQKPSAQVE